MNSLVFLAYCAFPLLAFGKSLDFIRSGVACMPESDETLKLKLQNIGGFNTDIIAFDRHSAKKNLEKAVLESNFKHQMRPKVYKKYTLQRVKQIVRSKGKYKAAKELESKDYMNSTLRSDASNCQEKGSLTSDGNLNLCRKCTVLTTLPPDRYPRIITETVCSPPNSRSLGNQCACVERSIKLNFLKKSSTCVANNDGTFSEEWKPYKQSIRVGCECEIRQGSYLTALITS